MSRITFRTAVSLALVLALFVLAAAPASAQRSRDRAPREPKKAKSDTSIATVEENEAAQEQLAVFEMESEALRQHPEVGAALARLEGAPEDVAAWRNLGSALVSAGARLDAIRAFRRGVALAPGDPDAWVDLGAAQVRAGDPGDGSRSLRKGLDIEPFHARGHYNLAIAYQELDRYEESITEFETAFLLDPDLADPTINPAAVNNPHLPIIKLRLYMRTTGALPTLFGQDTE